MMDLTKKSIIGITVAAIIAAILEYISPDGAVKKVVKFAGGILLLFVIIQPFISIENSEITEIFSSYQVYSEKYSSALEIENQNLMKIIIAEKTAAYIQDKAEMLGIACEVEVECRTNGKETPYPAYVIIKGDLLNEQINQLTKTIEQELAISAENQRYERKFSDEGEK